MVGIIILTDVDIKNICHRITRKFDINLPLQFFSYDVNGEETILEIIFEQDFEIIEEKLKSLGPDIKLAINDMGRITFLRILHLQNHYIKEEEHEFLDLD
ncbi:MAG: hypothetical protein ACW981_18015 [Candidatus Hodarchaeales archaeon]